MFQNKEKLWGLKKWPIEWNFQKKKPKIWLKKKLYYALEDDDEKEASKKGLKSRYALFPWLAKNCPKMYFFSRIEDLASCTIVQLAPIGCHHLYEIYLAQLSPAQAKISPFLPTRSQKKNLPL